MNTFMPFKDYWEVGVHLDSARLNKQIIEAGQMLNALNGTSSGWRFHPATIAWENHIEALEVYRDVLKAVVYVKKHSPATNPRHAYKLRMAQATALLNQVQVMHPPWVFSERTHRIMKQNLLFKGRKDRVRELITRRLELRKQHISFSKWLLSSGFPRLEDLHTKDIIELEKYESVIRRTPPIELENFYAKYRWDLPAERIPYEYGQI